MSPEPLLPSLLSAGLTELVKGAAQRVARGKRPPDAAETDSIKEGLAYHLRVVSTWSSRVHIFGMAQQQDIGDATVPLSLGDLPRRFRSPERAMTTRSEEEALLSRDHYAVLGDPGAGKTTTLKRFARRLLSAPSARGDIWAYPIVFLFREHHDWSSMTLSTALGSTFGLDLRNRPSWVNPSLSDAQILATLIDNGPAVLLLDGLDEVPATRRRAVETDIATLADNLRVAKIIVSCRSADYNHLEGFTLAELEPLTSKQVAFVAKRWLGDPTPFLTQVNASPIADLVDRPLFLAQLLLVFQNGGEQMPDQPCALYRQIIRLMLQDWDAQRRVVRVSSYGQFHVEEKLEFLSALSFRLTVDRKTARFSSALLEELYVDLAPKFGLPNGDARSVAREIETHTGIIVESGQDFEFSHLSLQEYLCAYHMVRQPYSDVVGRYLDEYPGPVAIAVALSSDPSGWFATCLLRPSLLPTDAIIGSFLSRVVQERPRFTAKKELGFAVVRIMTAFTSSNTEPLVAFLRSDAIAESTSMAWNHYTVAHDRKDGSVTMTYADPMESWRSFNAPPKAVVTDAVYKAARAIIRK